ncbi:hypothetical protein DSUL_170001 [Desulfovibrionales bacterium]
MVSVRVMPSQVVNVQALAAMYTTDKPDIHKANLRRKIKCTAAYLLGHHAKLYYFRSFG